MRVQTVVLLGLVHTTLASIASTKKEATTKNDVATTGALSTPNSTKAKNETRRWAPNHLDLLKLKTRRKKSSERSTSSSSGEKGDRSKSAGGSSLAFGSSDRSSDADKTKAEKYKAKYENKEATGWRRWHRKCTPCPEDMVKKWRDHSIRWICGGYQRARRSFKSECMMHYRNCQDGTMFVKIHEHRCPDKAPGGYQRGRHFFYDYKVKLPDDTSDSTGLSSSTSSEKSSSSLDTD